MSKDLTEEEMRQALFGNSQNSQPSQSEKPAPVVTPSAKPAQKAKPTAKPLSPKLRVTLHVSREFEGQIDVFVHDANTISTFVAEQEAKNEAKKKKYKYFEVVSTKPI